MSENSGSIVSKNTIRNSMNRCINLKGSNNMVVDGNVAYKTRGHCFAVGSDSTGNTFSNNIGAVTQNAINIIDGQTDNFASTFHIAHPSNIFLLEIMLLVVKTTGSGLICPFYKALWTSQPLEAIPCTAIRLESRHILSVSFPPRLPPGPTLNHTEVILESRFSSQKTSF